MHEPDTDTEDAMKPLGTLGAAAAGALAMYYLDPELGAQRRALLAKLVRRGAPDAGSARSRARSHLHALPRPVASADARSDAELRHRLQARLGCMVSHPGAIHVSVQDGVVRLSGRVLAKELEGLLAQLRQVPGVLQLENTMASLDHPQQIASRPAVSLVAATR
jgi:osmotically-inducible protein OsmY